MRYIGPKNRIARQEGVDLELKTVGTKSHARLIKKLNIKPGQHGASRRKKLTGYGTQLREKQKLKRIYGLTEKKLKNYFLSAKKMHGNTSDLLMQSIEHRLDNVVFRLGFAPTRASARQLIVHGHIGVNEKKNTFPSYKTKVGDVITFLTKKTIEIPEIAIILSKKDFILQPWVERQGNIGKVSSVYKSNEENQNFDLQSIIEFYSR